MRYISIHAPVKGATERMGAFSKAMLAISIHAPVKGATPAATVTMHGTP